MAIGVIKQYQYSKIRSHGCLVAPVVFGFLYLVTVVNNTCDIYS